MEKQNETNYSVENFITADATKIGIETKYAEAGIRPQDDLYRHVNGKWLEEFQIPADRGRDGAFRKLVDEAEIAVKVIIENSIANPNSDLEKKIGALYKSFMDVDRLQELGTFPLRSTLAELKEIETFADFIKFMAKTQKKGNGGLLGFYVDTDSGDSKRNLLHVTQSGLGMPDESYYLDAKNSALQKAYKQHIKNMLQFVGEEFATELIVNNVYNLEAEIAGGFWDAVKRRDATLTYNLFKISDLVKDYPNLYLEDWLFNLGIPTENYAEIVVREPSFLAHVNKLAMEISLDTWKNWFVWVYLRNHAGELSEEIAAANFEFYGKALTGSEVIRDRWKRGVSAVEDGLGFAVGKIYTQKYFPESTKKKMDELVQNLIKAYEISIKILDWMSESTKEKALTKLSKFTPKIGYPDKDIDYSSLELSDTDLFGNMENVAEFLHQREIKKLANPVDKSEWFMTPQTVNAYYNPGWNEIVFPAAILQPPFFNPEADAAVNYGAIGAVIGHEIGHGFDDQGAKYDGDGNLINWWNEQDLQEFSKRTQQLIEQYNQYVPVGLSSENKVNGALTVGENIGDLGGLTISILAYKLALKGEEAPIINGLTGLQRLFLGWAAIWRNKSREQEAICLLTIDPHSPAEFRSNGVVSNIPEFYEEFQVNEGDRLYLSPEKRVKIW